MGGQDIPQKRRVCTSGEEYRNNIIPGGIHLFVRFSFTDILECKLSSLCCLFFLQSVFYKKDGTLKNKYK